MANRHIKVCFAYSATKYWEQCLVVGHTTTLEQAIDQSGFAQQFPALNHKELGVSVFGRKVGVGYILQENDRIELCRPLNADPKESRKRRALHRQAGILKAKHTIGNKKINYDENR